MKTKVLALKMYFICITLIMLINNLKAATPDSLKIEPVAPTENDSIYLISYVTIPNCCNPYDSVIYEVVSDTIIGIIIYHTEHYPQCDCYSQCIDTVPLGKYNPGNYRLICMTTFIDTVASSTNSVVDEIYFTVSTITGITFPESFDERIKVYPIPSGDLAYIENIPENCQFEILDLTGKIWLNGVLQDKRIDISKLKNGIYILRISDGSTIIINKKIEILRN